MGGITPKRPKREDFIKEKQINTKHDKTILKLESLVMEYEKSITLSEYSKGRLAGYRFALDIIKNNKI